MVDRGSKKSPIRRQVEKRATRVGGDTAAETVVDLPFGPCAVHVTGELASGITLDLGAARDALARVAG